MKYVKTEKYETEVEEFFDIAPGLLRIRLIKNDEVKDDFFYDQKDLDTLVKRDLVHLLHIEQWGRYKPSSHQEKKNLLDLISRRYLVRTPLFLESYKNGDIDRYISSEKKRKECNRIIEPDEAIANGFELDLLGQYTDRFFFPFSLEGGYPLAKQILIGDEEYDIDDLNFDLDALSEHLEKDPRISDIEIHDIDRRYTGSEAEKYMTYVVKLPQEEFNDLWDKTKPRGIHEFYWQLGKIGALTKKGGFDFLGLAQFCSHPNVKRK